MTSGNIPEEGSEVIMPPYKFVLEQVSDTKIETVRVLVVGFLKKKKQAVITDNGYLTMDK